MRGVVLRVHGGGEIALPAVPAGVCALPEGAGQGVRELPGGVLREGGRVFGERQLLRRVQPGRQLQPVQVRRVLQGQVVLEGRLPRGQRKHFTEYPLVRDQRERGQRELLRTAARCDIGMDYDGVLSI